MFDGSTLPYEQNVKKTAQVAAAGALKKVGVEGELGRVKYPDERKQDPVVEKTDIAQAVDFVKRTKVCAFAVAIGNTHGLPVEGEQLDFVLLKKIQQALRVPLVLHGASGTPPADIKKAISLGIAKINIDTDLRLAFTSAVREKLHADQKLFDPRAILEAGRTAVQNEVQRHMKLFGSVGKA
jgi:fructose-bisphosphate aldolase class II